MLIKGMSMNIIQSRELNVIKHRFGIMYETTDLNSKVEKDKLFLVEEGTHLSETFIRQKPNCMMLHEVKALIDASELIMPEIPRLINTIENTYINIAVYGRSDYAEKIYQYLYANKNIQVTRIEEEDFFFHNAAYILKHDKPIDMLLVMDLLIDKDVFDSENNIILTVFAKRMYYTSLKSTGNNLDINRNIIPKLLGNQIQIIWVGIAELKHIKKRKLVGLAIKIWTAIRKRDENLFPKLRNRWFHTSYLDEEVMAVYNTNVKGISEVFFNGKYINFENGFRTTPGNTENAENSIWLFGPCYVRGLGHDDNHTMSAKLQQLVGDKYNVLNRGTVNTCLNYVMRMSDYKAGDIVVFFAPETIPDKKDENIIYLDMNAVMNEVPHLQRHITDDLYHCDEIVIDAMVKNIFAYIPKKKLSTDKTHRVSFGSSIKRVPSMEMYEENEYIKWLKDLKVYMREGNNGAIVMNANPFTNGHRYLIEYASKQVDNLFVFIVQEDKSFFRFNDRLQLVKAGTKDIRNVIVLPSSQYIISSSSLPGYFNKENMIGKYKLDATQDLVSFAQAANVLNIKVRFAGEEPLDPFTNQYNANMQRVLPQYGIEFKVIPRKTQGGQVISASRVRKCLKDSQLETIRELVPEPTYRFLKQMQLEGKV